MDDLWPGRSELQQVLPGLYISNAFGAKKKSLLQRENISAVLNVTNDLPFANESLQCKRVGFADNTNVALPLAECLDFVDEVLSSGGRVLVHCAAGSSRSGSIVVACVMSRQKMRYAEALQHVQQVRPIVLPNPGGV